MPGEGDPIIRSELEGGDVAIDVGANPKGDDVTCLMCELVGSDGLVIAFDPFPMDGFHAYETEYETVVCIAEAVSNDRVSMEETSGNVGSSRDEYQDRSYEGGIPLDIVAYADLVKVDVEGNEYDILNRGARLLEGHHPDLLIELHKWKEKKNGWTRSMLSLLHNLDYDIYSVTKERKVTSLDDLRDGKADKIFCKPQLRRHHELVHQREWDWLLVLDACRYDAFEALYENYLDGTLQEVHSSADQTLECVSKTWPETYDITYISSHPASNSEGITGAEPTKEGDSDVVAADQGSLPVNRFAKIVDVWDFGYDEAIEAVHPEAINDALRDADPTCVAHYGQPQFPWNRGSQWADRRDVEIPGPRRTEIDPEGSSREPRFSRQRVETHLGEEGVKYAYKDNLEFVLEHVSTVVAELHTTVVTTAHHGESMPVPTAFPAGLKDRVFRTVPWLEVS